MIKKAVCAECGKTFEYLYNKHMRKYCSDECSRIANNRHSSRAFKRERYKTKRNEQVEDFERQARTQGLSYGQLQALKRLEAEHGS